MFFFDFEHLTQTDFLDRTLANFEANSADFHCLIVTSSAIDKKIKIDRILENKLEIYKNLEN